MKYYKIIIIFAILGLISFLLYRAQLNSYNKKNTNQAPVPTSVTETPSITPEATIIVTPVEYDKNSPKGYEGFFEEMPVIAKQQGYVAYPKKIYTETPPNIVIYYHGSGQTITTNFNDEVMKNMRYYGNFFASKNYAFLASAQHGDNYGSNVAIEDSRALIKWVKDRYHTSTKVYVLGFSMGGLPALKHVILYPKETFKIALLAPVNDVEHYTATQIKTFKNVPLEIWHGTSDVNVPYSATELLVKAFNKQKTPIVVHTLKGKTHFQVDTEYAKEIYNYYEKLL